MYENICKAIEFNGINCLQSCFRLPTRNYESSSAKSKRHLIPSIILKFWSSDGKAGFFKQYITKKNLCTTSIGFSAPGRIYINENLTKKNFEIHRMARRLKAESKVFQYNTFSGRVFIKLSSDSNQIGIDSKEHLNSLISSVAAQQQQNQQIQQTKQQHVNRNTKQKHKNPHPNQHSHQQNQHNLQSNQQLQINQTNQQQQTQQPIQLQPQQ